MFAINHAATALIIKKRYPNVPMAWLLLSVQFVEILWVILNFLGIERTTTEATVNTVKDIHLVYMPFSHSIASSLLYTSIAWYVLKYIYKQRIAAMAVALGLISHIILDVLTHTQDILVLPFVLNLKVGLGLYSIPMAAFFVETFYGLLCWWIFQGDKKLLVIILGFNLANISFFSVAIRGPEVLMANHPLWIVSAVAIQIVVTLILVGVYAKPATAVNEKQTA